MEDDNKIVENLASIYRIISQVLGAYDKTMVIAFANITNCWSGTASPSFQCASSNFLVSKQCNTKLNIREN